MNDTTFHGGPRSSDDRQAVRGRDHSLRAAVGAVRRRTCTRRSPQAETPRRPRPRSKRWRGRAASCCSARTDHGALLRLAGQKRKAIQYVVGNPLFALQMTQHDIRASLYAPLRVLIYENEQGKTCVEYDRPSSLFGQFGNDRISPTAAMLDKKLEALVAAAFE